MQEGYADLSDGYGTLRADKQRNSAGQAEFDLDRANNRRMRRADRRQKRHEEEEKGDTSMPRPRRRRRYHYRYRKKPGRLLQILARGRKRSRGRGRGRSILPAGVFYPWLPTTSRGITPPYTTSPTRRTSPTHWKTLFPELSRLHLHLHLHLH